MLFWKLLDNSPGSEPPSLYQLFLHRFLTSLSTGKHPRPGHSTCGRYHFHPRLSREKESEKNTEVYLMKCGHLKECGDKARCYGIAYFSSCRMWHSPTLQLVSLRSDLPSCWITLEMILSCCAVADSWWLLLCHSDTLWRRPGLAGSADITLLLQHANTTVKYS